jgi:hypothetical protein
MELKPICKRLLLHSNFELPVLYRRIDSDQTNVGAFEWIIAKSLRLSGFSRTFFGIVVTILRVCGF